MSPAAPDELDEQLKKLRAIIRDIAHDIRNPLGVLRMATYYLQGGNADSDKREQYLKLINENVDKVEANLDRLKALSDNPPLKDQSLPLSEGPQQHP